MNKYLTCSLLSFSILILLCFLILHKKKKAEPIVDKSKVTFPEGTPEAFLRVALAPANPGSFEDTQFYFGPTPRGYFEFKFDEKNQLVSQRFMVGCLPYKRLSLREKLMFKNEKEENVKIRQRYIDMAAKAIQSNVAKYLLGRCKNYTIFGVQLSIKFVNAIFPGNPLSSSFGRLNPGCVGEPASAEYR